MTTPLQELDASQVQVGTPNGPGIYIAPPMTPPPADTTSEWPEPWHVLGYLSEDGPTVGSASDSEDLVPWQSLSPIRTIRTSRSVTLQFVLWQLNPETLSLYFDTDTPTADPDGSFSMDVRTDESGHIYAVGIDARDGNRVLRLAFPRASLSDAGDMQIQRGAIVPLDCTLSALETNGSLATIRIGPAVAGLAMDVSDNGVSTTRTRNGNGNGNGHTQPAPRGRRHSEPAE